MSDPRKFALIALRWSVGVVVLWESCRFLVSATAAHCLQRMGLPHWIRPALGISEIGAAVLFLIPKWNRLGGYALLLLFAIAAVVHVLHGQFEIGTLLVYAAAVLVCVWTQSPDIRSAS